MVNIQYNKWYKDLAQRVDFSFKGAHLGRSREIISYYIFKILIDIEINLEGLILHMKKFDVPKFILQIKEIFTNKEKHLTREEIYLLNQLTDREMSVYKDMGINYSDVFDKYFTDLVKLVKMLIISNKSHIIIGADFSAAHFGKFLLNNNVNLLMQHSETFFKAIRDIFHYLKDSKYSSLFPNLNKTDKSGNSKQTRIDHKRKDIVGSRIKLYVMKNIYKRKYLDKRDGNIKCPDCLREGFIINMSTPRKRSKDFHHPNGSSKEDYNRYDSNELFSMFAQNRGNPYFLEDIISEIESKSVVLKCTNHHRMIHYAEFFTYFRKLICWENIPKEFPYQDIFDLPTDVIHTLVLICLENFYKTKMKTKQEKTAIKLRLINAIKKKYIID